MIKNLTKKQAEAIQSKSKRKVLNFGRRSGKTTALGYEAMITALKIDGAKITYYAQTFDDARNIAWDIFLDILGDSVIKKNETRLEITVLTMNGKTSLISLKGWESVVTSQKGRGTENDLLLLDEVAFLRGFKRMWDNVLEPTLLTTRGRVVFSSTPNGFNDFYELSKKAQAHPEWFYLHATSYDNPHNPPEELDRLKIEKDAESPESFNQEYLADFKRVQGLVCDWWQHDIHINEAGELDEWYEVIDGGYSDPTAYLLIGVSESAVYVVDGFRDTRLHAEDISELRNDLIGSRVIDDAWIDNDNPRLEAELNDLGISVKPVEKIPGDAKSWDEALSHKLAQYGRVEHQVTGIYIDPKLDWLIQEIETLTWKESVDKEVLPKWDDHRRGGHHFDGMRALAYFLISFSRSTGGLVYWEGTDLISKIANKDELAYDPNAVFDRKMTNSQFK